MRVLYVNHTARISGGERSLLDVLGALPADVSPAVACPDGPLADAVRALGIPVFPVLGMEGGLRMHPAYTGAALVAIVRAAATTKRISARFGADLVHANSIRAGVVAGIARALGAPPAVAYVRDCLPPGILPGASLGIMGRGAAALLPNSHYTAATLDGRVAAPVWVIHSPIALSRFDAGSVDRAEARAGLGLSPDEVVLTVVGQLTPWKAQDDAIRVLALLRRRRHNVRLLLAGSAKFLSKATRYDNDAYRVWLGKLALALDVQREVVFLGEREDVPEIFAASDIALLPSWEEPFGRSLIEAMAMERAVVATDVGGPPEILTHEREGLLLPPRSPALWSDAVERLIRDDDRRARLARAARARVADAFSVERHVEALLEAYSRVSAGAELKAPPDRSDREIHTREHPSRL